MVRKRSRKYESDDNSDSDVDFDVESTREPAPKKYSLRERKSAPSLVEFDYYGLDDEEEVHKHSSEDEDFEVEADVESARTYFEPSSDTEAQCSEGLIDFEDIIRADIVVNKNKIDYDNIIQKTEIKLTQPKKRGRKPKNQVKDEIKNESETDSKTEITVEPDAEALRQLDSQSKTELKEESQLEVGTVMVPNGDCSENLENTSEDSQIETDPLALKNVTNGGKSSPEPPPVIEVNHPPNGGGETKVAEEEEEDDDVIVLGELKQDVIVLDD